MWPYTRSIDALGEDKAALRGDAETARLAFEGEKDALRERSETLNFTI